MSRICCRAHTESSAVWWQRLERAVLPERSLNIFTSVALKGVLERIAPEFARSTGLSFTPTYAPAGVIVRRMREGATADALVVTPETWPVLVAEGHGAAGTERNVASSVIGVAVRVGARRPDISTPEAFRQALIDAKSVAYTDPSTGAASGVHFMALLERFGIADAVKAKGNSRPRIAERFTTGPHPEYLSLLLHRRQPMRRQ